MSKQEEDFRVVVSASVDLVTAVWISEQAKAQNLSRSQFIRILLNAKKAENEASKTEKGRNRRNKAIAKVGQ